MPDTIATDPLIPDIEPTQRVAFYNSDLRFQFSYDSGVFFVGERRHIVRDHVTAMVIDLVIKRHPTIAEYDEISLLLMRKQNVGSGVGDRATVQRYIHKVSRFWEGVFPHCPLFYNVRGKGYTISSFWLKIESASYGDEFNEINRTLSQIVDSALAYLERSNLVFTESGTSFIQADSAYRTDIISKLDALFWSVIKQLDVKCPYPKLTQLRRLLMDLFSFVTFWRLGDMINEEKWRSDYKNEINHLAASIRAEIKIEP